MGDDTRILQILGEVGAILTEGHFLYASGKHGSVYINKDAVYPHIAHVRTICEAMAQPLIGQRIDTVAGPTVGGVILSQWVAQALSTAEQRPVMACYAEERMAADGTKSRYFGRGYDQYIRDHRVLVVEDILNTGGSVRHVVDAVRACGGEVVAVSALCNRGGVPPADVGHVPVHVLVTLSLQAWDPAACPLCRQGVPINTQFGKGKQSPATK